LENCNWKVLCSTSAITVAPLGTDKKQICSSARPECGNYVKKDASAISRGDADRPTIDELQSSSTVGFCVTTDYTVSSYIAARTNICSSAGEFIVVNNSVSAISSTFACVSDQGKISFGSQVGN
jgi:hypothetical protein